MLNEVGGEPSRFGMNVEEYHRSCVESHDVHPFTMLATATHDTKRGEDVRMRLAVLSEIPDRWAAMVRYWSAKNDPHRTQFLPDRNAEYLYYQTLVGAWPIGPDRVIPYMEKATRESKQHTSWISVNEEYESALRSFIEQTLADQEFVESVSEFVQEVVGPGRVNSLAQVLLKLTAPGVPDIYQGTELWDLSLVDPDNRRAVDYDQRRKLLAALEGMSPENILQRMEEGLPKLWVVRQTLRLRSEQPGTFTRGTYTALRAAGLKADHVVACMRGESIIAVAPRLPLTLNGQWEETSIELPAKAWKNVLTGETLKGGKIQLADLLGRFPVALLAS
jgi:(1->4)-alpha-D-glucan 1-alpha-D-glucosylmutase